MGLEQFERLGQLIKETTDLVVRLKFENKTLKEENEKLKNELQSGTEKSAQNMKRLEEKNIFLKQRQEKTTSRLMHIRNKIQNLSQGVET
jgi:FtsZ-binding cell division protein ZapB